jgi:hypothetical protein
MQFLIYDFFIASIAVLMEREHSLDDKALAGHDFSAEVKTFLCLNATPRPIRICVLAALAATGVLESTLWSLLKEASGKDRAELTQVEELIVRLDLKAALPYVARFVNGPPKFLDYISVSNSNQLASRISQALYDQSFMSIVTETDFSSGEIRRVTEKLIKALAVGHPAIVFGNPGSLALAREFGFETFSPIIDETYDVISDPAERFKAVLSEIVLLQERLTKRDTPERRRLAEIGNANLSHAISGSFRRRYADVVESPLIDGLKQLVR